MNFAHCRTNELEFRICTAKIFNTKFTNRLKKCQRRLSAFANNVSYFFIINAFINVYYYFFGLLTYLRLRERSHVTARLAFVQARVTSLSLYTTQSMMFVLPEKVRFQFPYIWIFSAVNCYCACTGHDYWYFMRSAFSWVLFFMDPQYRTVCCSILKK